MFVKIAFEEPIISGLIIRTLTAKIYTAIVVNVNFCNLSSVSNRLCALYRDLYVVHICLDNFSVVASVDNDFSCILSPRKFKYYQRNLFSTNQISHHPH